MSDKLSLPPIEPFDENYKSSKHWIRKFKEYQNYYKWDEDHSLQVLKIHLVGKASEWYYQ